MLIKQVAVFIENREGRLGEVAKIVSTNKINILALSLADTSEYGMLRMVVSDPEKAEEVLKKEGFSVRLTDVIGVRMENRVGANNALFEAIASIGTNIEYMYTVNGKESAVIIFKVKNPEMVQKALFEAGIEIAEPQDVYNNK